MKYLLQLGRLPELGKYEAKQCFPTSQLEILNDQFVTIEMGQTSQVFDLLEQMGGVIKAFELMTEADSDQDFQTKIIDDLVTNQVTDFSVFFTPHKDALPFMKEIKTALKEHNLSGRYVSSSVGGLSASILTHNRVSEYGVVHLNGQVLLLKTFWSQHIDHWSMKDIEKPHRDPDKGMIPPKLARMMINFVSPEIKQQAGKRLYDPFCGTGTILMEASELGWEAIGSDIDQVSINQSGANLHWFSQYLQTSFTPVLFTADATHVSTSQTNGQVDAIVTEPFLGKQQPKPDQLPNIFKGLEKLYWGTLKTWTQLLKPGGEVVLITPLVIHGDKRYSLEKIIDKSQELEYSILSGPLMYSREHTIVQRAIYHLKFRS